MSVYIIGPCAMESSDLYFTTGARLYEIMKDKDWYYKSSFDKANRTSFHGQRGIGLDEALDEFERIKEFFPDIKLTTDAHECWQIHHLVGYIDLIQIPAFLCRQTDLIIECAKYFKKINIKKGQWIGPNNLIKSVDKIRNINPNAEVWITNRGSNFGYHELIVDNNIVDILKECYDGVILDATHSVQRSRSVYGIQGDRDLAERHFLSSGIFGYTGVFAEVHPNPPEAISDGDCQIYLNRIEELIKTKEEIDDILY